MATPRDDLDPLLANTRWVRALGVELLGAGEADDVVQDAWLVALESPGGVLDPPAWFAGVLRRLARRKRRSAERRVQRERAVARPEAQPPADELVAEAEVQRELIRAVTELAEPQRTTVLLRYFRGWTSEEIARAEGVPAATVRTRLHRALAKLRERLDREHGSRAAWALAFASPAGLATATAGTAASAATLAGGAWMGTKGLLAGAALLAALAGYWLWQGDGGSRTELARAEGRVASLAAAPAGDGQASPTSAGAARAAEREALAPAAAAFAEVLLFGAVTDAAGRAIELDSLGLESAAGAARSVGKSSAGSYALAGLAPGRYTLRAKAKGFVTRREELVVRADEEHQRHDLVLAPALEIPVFLVDENGASLADWGRSPNRLSLDVVATRAAPSEGLCGLQAEPGNLYGCAEFADLARLRRESVPDMPDGCAGLLRLWVEPPIHVSVILQDALLATQRVDGPLTELVFTLERAALERQLGGVRGRFVDALTGEPILGGMAFLDPRNGYSRGGELVAGAPAEFELTGYAPGLRTLRLHHPSHEGFALSVRIPAGRVLELGDVRVEGLAKIRGTVLGSDGQPIQGNLTCAPRSTLRGPADIPHVHFGFSGGDLDLAVPASGQVQLVVQAPEHALLGRTVDTSSGLVDDLVLQLEEGVPVALRCEGDALGRQLTLADAGGVPLVTWAVGDYTIRTRLGSGRYQLWTGVAERVDKVEELVVGTEPLTRTISFE